MTMDLTDFPECPAPMSERQWMERGMLPDDWEPSTPDGKALLAERAADRQSLGDDPFGFMPKPVVLTRELPTDPGRHIIWELASSMHQRAARWLWEEGDDPWLPLGGLSLLGGREGVGKSTWAYRLAAQVTRGTLPGDLFGEARAVVVAATEDAWEQVILPRCVAAGADLDLIVRCDVYESGVMAGLSLPTDHAALAQVCRTLKVALILLDPLLGTVGTKLDTHKDADVRQALEPLSRLAHEEQLSIIGLIHQNKGSGDMLTRLMGSRAFSAVSRAVLVAAKEDRSMALDENADAVEGNSDDGRDTYVLGQEKSNLGRPVRHSIRYAIEGVVTGFDPWLQKKVRSSRIQVVGTTDEKVSDMVARQEANTKAKPDSKQGKAARWLEQYLKANGPTPSATVRDVGGAEFGERLLRRAATDVDVKIERLPDGTSIWSLKGQLRLVTET